MRRVVLVVVGMLLLLAPGRLWAQLDIHLNPSLELQANPDALAAWERAAQSWEKLITTPIRVNIDADLESFAHPFIIGSTSLGPANPNLDYTSVRNAMVARASRPGNGILNFLPTTSQIAAHIPEGLGNEFDPTTIGLTSANQKALGLLSKNDPVVDGFITFNSDFFFDYDRGDGVGFFQTDFETVAAHEIGHVLGFLSDTDDFDRFAGISDNVTTWDLFRFNDTQLPTTTEQFRLFPRELRPGESASFTDLSHIYPVSTGANFGDGRQASHWKDDEYTGILIGLMDPSLDSGFFEPITEADLRVLELIGYDTLPLPEPGALGMVLTIVLFLRKR